MSPHLLAPVHDVFRDFNWENRTTPRFSLIGIPTTLVLRDWSVEQFFSAMPWTIPRDPGGGEPIRYEEDPMLTLASFADLF